MNFFFQIEVLDSIVFVKNRNTGNKNRLRSHATMTIVLENCICVFVMKMMIMMIADDNVAL